VDHRALATGTSLLSASTLALVKSDGSGAIWQEPFEDKQLRAAPPGRLVAATAAPPARLVLARSSKTGFLQLAQVVVPPPGEPWPDAKQTLVSYVSELEMAPSPDLWCGLAAEPHFTWLGHGGENHVLVAANPNTMYPFRFKIRNGSDLAVLCGVCPPTALERGPQGLRVFLPVIRKLAPATITTPLAFDASSPKSATAACTGEQIAASYLAANRVLSQSTRSGDWRFQRPELVAEPNPHGTPSEPQTLGFDDHVVVLWRRSAPGSSRVRLEIAEIRAE
jgi:hypothetical protein